MPHATLAGVPLHPPFGVSWTLRTGVAPSESVFELHHEEAQRVWDAAATGPVRLEIHSSGSPAGQPLKIEQLFVVELLAGSLPQTRRLRVVDQRYWWAYDLFERSYNVRRLSGDLRKVGERLETAQLLPEVEYAEFSLNDGQPWDPPATLADALAHLTRNDLGWELGVPAESLPEVEIEDLFTGGLTGAAALEEILRNLPGLTVDVDPSGFVVVKSRTDQSERTVLQAAGLKPLGTSAEFPIVSQRAPLRPARVHVLFERELEARLRFRDAISSDSPFLFLENVLRLPDPELTVDGELHYRGTWLPFGDTGSGVKGGVLAAWGADGQNPLPDGLPPLSQDTIRRHFPSGFRHLWAGYVQGSGLVNPLWDARLQGVVGSWWQSFRVSRQLRAAVSALYPRRVAIVDRGEGTRARAEVLADWIVKPTLRGIAAAFGGDSQRSERGWAVSGKDGRARDLELGSPFLVALEDPDNLVLRVAGRPDWWGESAKVLLGRPAGGELPSQDLGAFNLSEGAQVLATWDALELAEGQELDVIVTVVQGAPNSEKRLHEEIVGPGDEELKTALGQEPGECRGRDLYVRVLPSLGITAQFAWSEDHAEAFEEVFTEGTPPPAEQLLNREHVRAVAVAIAAAVYEARLDRVQCNAFDVDLVPELQPTGAITSVTHRLAPRGESVSTIQVPAVVTPASFMKFLGPETRKILLQVGQGLQ